MLDILAALRWVKTNIEAFGGNPDNVMVSGESGGGFKVGTLLAMPSAQGLFHKAAIESGAALRRVTKEDATETARRVLKGLSVDRHELHRLADVPVDEFVKIQLQAGQHQGPLFQPSGASGAAAAHAPDLGPVVPSPEGNGPGVAETARNMSQLWTSFARTGRPGAPGVPTWPRYDLNSRATMIVDAKCRVENNPDHEIRELWARLPGSPG